MQSANSELARHRPGHNRPPRPPVVRPSVRLQACRRQVPVEVRVRRERGDRGGGVRPSVTEAPPREAPVAVRTLEGGRGRVVKEDSRLVDAAEALASLTASGRLATAGSGVPTPSPSWCPVQQADGNHAPPCQSSERQVKYLLLRQARPARSRREGAPSPGAWAGRCSAAATPPFFVSVVPPVGASDGAAPEKPVRRFRRP